MLDLVQSAAIIFLVLLSTRLHGRVYQLELLNRAMAQTLAALGAKQHDG